MQRISWEDFTMRLNSGLYEDGVAESAETKATFVGLIVALGANEKGAAVKVSMYAVWKGKELVTRKNQPSTGVILVGFDHEGISAATVNHDGMLSCHVPGRGRVFIYPKNHPRAQNIDGLLPLGV